MLNISSADISCNGFESSMKLATQLWYELWPKRNQFVGVIMIYFTAPQTLKKQLYFMFFSMNFNPFYFPVLIKIAILCHCMYRLWGNLFFIVYMYICCIIPFCTKCVCVTNFELTVLGVRLFFIFS